MNAYALLPLSGFLVNVMLAIAVLARSPRARNNRLYAAIAVALAYWSLLKFARWLVADAQSAILLFQLSAFGWCLIPSLYLHFSAVFTRADQDPRMGKAIWAAHAVGLGFALSALVPGAMVSGMVAAPWGFVHVPAVAYRIFSIYLAATFIVVLVLLGRALRKARIPEERTQLRYLLLGMSFPLIGGVITNMLLPMVGVRVVELGEVLSTVNAAVIGWAMAHHGLLEVSLEQAAETLLGTMGDALLVTDRMDKIVLSNDAAARLLGLSVEELRGRPLAELVSAPVSEDGSRERSRPLRSEDAMLKPVDAEPIPVLLSAGPVHDPKKRLRGVVYVARDIRDIRTMVQQLHELSITDELTGVHNRRFAAQTLREELTRSLRYGRALSVGVVDLDDFKQVNDTFGHVAGDEVLKLVAAVLRNSVRGTDVVARWGGDEFLLLMPETADVAARSVCKRVLSRIIESDVPGVDHRIGGSIGLATIDLDAPPADADALVRAADEALYSAKDQGKGILVHAFNQATQPQEPCSSD